ncbi:type II toxin-antitoxin system RelE/ParE family toxin [Thermococcus sp. MAR1]|uniref:type II toxin-antitoxin system RelE family toxin n=1 Tax=Thermococcus sp. MAR1 TaxID=1638263 RepID=UPI001438E51A|nr:type II toxin-antitoxin system RelE/ParE family toxin [Thermococcus sp. MAR1]NJE09561.1 type II toxin-antitoxin system RelE/ParE family toxin [Thermococcus sp. MAR1]
MYEVVFTKKAAKQVRSLQPAHKRKLKEIILRLSENPFSYPYKKIRGEEHTYRIRVGSFRILYEVDDENFRVTIFKIERRERAYR